MIKLYNTSAGIVLERDGKRVTAVASFTLDALFSSDNPSGLAAEAFSSGKGNAEVDTLLAPIQNQEVWAAGVTYLRSKTARMEESKDSGGGSFYDRVYAADRPELFFKASPHRVAAPGSHVHIRHDSKWNVPEPELTLAINVQGKIFGYTIGNDMSSRDIEGENPLYLPQAKVYDRSAAIGPALVITDTLPTATQTIQIEIRRAGQTAFSGETNVGQIKRSLPSLAEWLYREDRFPAGAYLMTGTGIVPPDTFTLAVGDEVRITIEPVGTLVNTIATR